LAITDNSRGNLGSVGELRKSERVRNEPVRLLYEFERNIVMHVESELEDLPNTLSEIYGRYDTHLWIKAIQEEHNSLIENNTWTIVPNPGNVNVVKNKYIFKN